LLAADRRDHRATYGRGRDPGRARVRALPRAAEADRSADRAPVRVLRVRGVHLREAPRGTARVRQAHAARAHPAPARPPRRQTGPSRTRWRARRRRVNRIRRAGTGQLMSLLESRNITKRFAGIMALNDVSITVEHGEAVGLIGPNGAGKTTFFNG